MLLSTVHKRVAEDASAKANGKNVAPIRRRLNELHFLHVTQLFRRKLRAEALPTFAVQLP